MLPRLDALMGCAAAELADSTRPVERVRVETQPGTLGAYQLHERLGRGGQAFVYRARRIDDPDAGDLALKRLHPHLLDDEDAVRAFGREARIAYLLDHPVIRRVFSLCREPGELFMTMEYVDGTSLHGILERASRARRHLPLGAIVALLHRLCGALDHAHQLVDEQGAPAGLVHRDVSPSNLIVTAAGRLKLIDLGIARSEAAEHVTNSGLIKGKYGYMAPEVMCGAPFDGRADVFSVGVVAWELITTRKLFPVRNPPVDLERVRTRPIEPPSRHHPACPAEVDAVVLRALATDPADRWATCAAMAEALGDLAERLGLPLGDRAIAELAGDRDEERARPVPLPPPPRPRRSRLAFGAAIGAVATILVVSLGAAWRGAAQSDAAPPAVAAPQDAGVPRPPRAPAPRAAPADPAPLIVDASELIRVAGRAPRSRSSTDLFRARLCIDADGRVISATLLEGPERLEPRITRALRRWRYQPYRDEGGARPVCFDVESRLEKMPRRA